MNPVADQDHHPGCARPVLVAGPVRFAVVVVTVTPKHQLFEQEKYQDTGQYGRTDSMVTVDAGAIQRMGQQAE